LADVPGLFEICIFVEQINNKSMGLITPDFGLLFWMLLAFSIVLYILKKYAWKPILNALKEREKTIEVALKSAEKAKTEMAKLQADNENILAEARLERDKLIKEARQMKDKLIEEAKIQAQVEGQKLIEAARLSIQSEKKAAIKEIKDQVAELSVQIAEKLMKDKLGDSTNQGQYIDKLLKDIKLN
jgi:F-type H+-transporting ATPase subunit b